MYLSKEATNKEQSLKRKLLLSADDKASLDTELIWKRSIFFLAIKKESLTKRRAQQSKIS